MQQATRRTKVALFSGAPAISAGSCTPFLKWAGGKSELIPELASRLPRSFNTYWEPFLGGGALFFHVRPVDAVLSDLNEELINCYEIVKTNVEDLITELKRHRNDRNHFLRVRKTQPWELGPVERAARMIYLNKTCYNGLYRVNQRGEFNVPFGHYESPRICDEGGLRGTSKALQGVEIQCRDFRHVLYRARPGDFIYFDPPYSPLSSTSSFTAFTEAPFDEREQKALKQVFEALHERDCHLMLSNSDTPFIRRLFRDFHVATVHASRAINCRGDKRGKISELIITNY